MNKELNCATHGKVPWNGQAYCAPDRGGCGRVWHLIDQDHPLYRKLGARCVCGELIGTQEESPTVAVCPSCFEAISQKVESHDP